MKDGRISDENSESDLAGAICIEEETSPGLNVRDDSVHNVSDSPTSAAGHPGEARPPCDEYQ